MRLVRAAIVLLLLLLPIIPASASPPVAIGEEHIHGLGAFNQKGIFNRPKDADPGCGQTQCVDVCAKLPLGSIIESVEPKLRVDDLRHQDEWAKCWRHQEGKWWDCNAAHFRFYPGEASVSTLN